jgi:hypothetical protein
VFDEELGFDCREKHGSARESVPVRNTAGSTKQGPPAWTPFEDRAWALRPQVTSKRFTILCATPSLNDGKSNRSADKSMSARNSCRQVIARHPGTLVSSV